MTVELWMANEKAKCDVLAELKYIAASPLPEHGGFHPQVVLTAKRAIREIRKLKGLLKRRTRK